MDAVRDAVPIADLFSAYSSGDIDRVVSLIDAGASPFSRNDEGNTLFHLCCTNNTDGPRILERLLTLLASSESVRVDQFFITNNDGNTPLHLVCINGIIECVQLLLSRSTLLKLASHSPASHSLQTTRNLTRPRNFKTANVQLTSRFKMK